MTMLCKHTTPRSLDLPARRKRGRWKGGEVFRGECRGKCREKGE